jgi:predicted transcriptional regulator
MSEQQDIATMSVELVRSMIADGKVKDASEIPSIIEKIGATLKNLRGDTVAAPAPAALEAAPARREIRTAAETGQSPAVPIRESIPAHGEFIICLEDGKEMKMLKRHLRTVYGMSPDEYRMRWGLPANYPMVAPNYAKQKSKYAKKTGLGTHRMRNTVTAQKTKAEA